MIRVFEDANLKLSSVFSDVTGKTCTEVIDNVLAGNTDPEFLASLCTHWRLKSSQEEIALAVEGNFTEHHKFMLRAIRKSIENLESQIKDIDEEINRYMQRRNPADMKYDCFLMMAIAWILKDNYEQLMITEDEQRN